MNAPTRRANLWAGIAAVVAFALPAPIAALLPSVAGNAHGRIEAYIWLGFVFALWATGIAVARRLTRGRGWILGVSAVVIAVIAIVCTHASVLLAADVAKLAFATIIGSLIARFVEVLWWIVPAAVLVGVADAWSVFARHGVTHQIVAHHAAALSYAAISVPFPGDTINAISGSQLGVTDIIFCALYLTVAAIYKLAITRTIAAVTCGVVGTIILDVELLSNRAVPVLPLLSASFLIFNALPLYRAIATAIRER